MKTCFKCGKEKDLSEFYKHPEMADGHLNKCKECTKKDTIENYVKNREYYHEFDKKRNKLHHRVEARSKYQKENPEKMRELKKKWAQNNKHKTNAHLKVKRAIAKGILSRPIKCDRCDKESKIIEAHHPDYSKPLEVLWLCKECHTEEHWGKLVLNTWS